MTATPTLEVRNLRTHFFTRAGVVKAVDDVSFSIGRGKVLGLVGESGSGKTVTGFSVLGLVDPPGRIVGGEILFQGRDTAGLKPSDFARLGIGRTFQNLALFKHGTVVENILVGRHVHTKSSVLEAALFFGRNVLGIVNMFCQHMAGSRPWQP